jgi:hypothetical protein
VAAELLALAEQLRAAVAVFDPALVSGDDAAVVAEALAATEKACAAGRSRAALRAADCGLHRRKGFAGAHEWLGRLCGSSPGEARAALEAAAAVESCPETRDALLAGKLSMAQAGVIASTEEACPGSERHLVELAGRADLGALKDEARKRRLAAVNPDELSARQRRARSLRHWRDADGMVRLAVSLAPADGVALVNRIDAEAQRLRRRAGTEQREPFDAVAADALVALASGKASGPSGRTDLVIVCDLLAWRRGHVHGDETCHIIGGGPVGVAVAKELAQDAFVKAVIHDGVAIQTVAHFGRHIPAHLRTALDLGPVPELEGVVCVEEGCSRRYGVEWDHVNPVANGGLTSYANLEPRCTPDHIEKTERDRKAGLLGGRFASGGPP